MAEQDPDCIFCKIVAGRIPALKLLETDRVLAFMDVGPVRPGHILFIPKHHVAYLHELAAEDAAELGRHLPALGKALMAVSAAEGYNVLQNNSPAAGQAVFHLHVHLIPRKTHDGPLLTWQPTSPSQDELKSWQSRYRQALGRQGD